MARSDKDLGAAALEVLNRALRADPQALTALLVQRVSCNQRLAQDPTIHVLGTDEGAEIGPLGLINGILAACGCRPIAAKVQEGVPRIVGFEST